MDILKCGFQALLATLLLCIAPPCNAGEEKEALYNKALYYSGGGYGLDSYSREQKKHYPMAHALLATGEYNRYRSTGDTACFNRAVGHTVWLLNNADRNQDGFIGWGLPFAWDAFADSSVNPEHTEYTITTLLCLQALLDALEILASDNVLSTAQSKLKDRLNITIIRVFKSFLEFPCFSKDAQGLYHVWYSSRKTDSWNVVNVNAMWAGVSQRYIAIAGNNSPLAGELARIADSIVFGLLAAAHNADDALYWFYYAGDIPAHKKNRENDGVHAAYTAEGLLLYKKYGGKLGDRINTEAVYRGLRLYFSGDSVIASFSRPDIPTRTWTLGYFLLVFSRYFPQKTGDIDFIYHDLLSRSTEKGFSFLGTDGNDGRENPHYVRHNAHIAAGLSSCIWPVE